MSPVVWRNFSDAQYHRVEQERDDLRAELKRTEKERDASRLVNYSLGVKIEQLEQTLKDDGDDYAYLLDLYETWDEAGIGGQKIRDLLLDQRNS